jgi:hypothetical protein
VKLALVSISDTYIIAGTAFLAASLYLLLNVITSSSNIGRAELSVLLSVAGHSDERLE